MAAEAGAGIEGHVAEGLGLGRVDHLPDVDAHRGVDLTLSSLTSAMLTARKMFSVSLTASAVAVEETGTVLTTSAA